MNSFQFGHRVDAVRPCPGFDVEPSEIRPARSGGKVIEGSEDSQEGIGGAPPAEAGGDHPIESAFPRRGIRKIRDRRDPLEPPENVRTGTDIPKDGNEGAAQRGRRVATYEAL